MPTAVPKGILELVAVSLAFVPRRLHLLFVLVRCSYILRVSLSLFLVLALTAGCGSLCVPLLFPGKILEGAFSKDDGWKLLDAYTPTILRADLHNGGEDCVHYCMPGPIDHWVVLLYNMLLAETSDGQE